MPGGDGGPARRERGSEPPRLWTAAEANARLPQLRELLPQLREWASRLAEVHGELGRLSKFWGEELASRDQPDYALQQRLEAEWRNLARRLDEAVRSLSAEGIEVKQLESGLVDFYAVLDGELVYLCWKLEEAEVGFFHSLDGGFASRRPLSELQRTVPPDATGRP
jgi:hypothetical protein